MSTATTEQPKTGRGNPNLNLGKKTTENGAVQKGGVKKGLFVFKLVQEETHLKPVNNITGESDDNPYPPLYIAVTSGVAYNPVTQQIEEWRFLHGYDSIWVKDQQNPKPDENRINNIDGKNDIHFLKGYCKVRAHEKAKFQALCVNDVFEGNKNKINEVPVKFELIDPEKVRTQIRSNSDLAFEAEKSAREISFERMLPIAMGLGINVNDAEIEEPIRTAFILKSREKPELFLKIFNDPRHEIKYLVQKALSERRVKLGPNSLVMNDEEGKFLLEVDTEKDVAEEIALKVLSGNARAKDLYKILKEMSL